MSRFPLTDSGLLSQPRRIVCSLATSPSLYAWLASAISLGGSVALTAGPKRQNRDKKRDNKQQEEAVRQHRDGGEQRPRVLFCVLQQVRILRRSSRLKSAPVPPRQMNHDQQQRARDQRDYDFHNVARREAGDREGKPAPPAR